MTRPSRSGDVLRRRAGTSPLTGGLVLLLGFVLAVGGPPLLRSGLDGSPARLPVLYTPAVGTCLWVSGTTVTEVSSCDLPHHAEVTRTWNSGATVPGMPSAASPIGMQPEPSACLDAKYAYLDSEATDTTGFWSLVSPAVAGRLLAAPTPSGTADFPFHACVIGAIDGEPFVGTLRDGFTAARRPDSRFASCVGDRSMSGAMTWTTCDNPHSIEVLGSFRTETVFDGSAYVGPPEPSTLAAGCASVARSRTGSADPTYGGLLRVASESLVPEPVMVHRPGDTSFSGAGYVLVTKPWCFLEVTGPATLSSTLIGLGDAPLPVD